MLERASSALTAPADCPASASPSRTSLGTTRRTPRRPRRSAWSGLSLIFFYVLSGFLLFLPYVRGLTAERSSAKLPSTRNFALHRIARILPGYLAIFLVVNYVLRLAYVENPGFSPPEPRTAPG